MNFNREIQSILSLMDSDLLTLLEENRCIIAGGALTSVFTNREVNDIDVYFRDSESFSNVLRDIFQTHDYCSFTQARITHYTNKSILLETNGQKVQFIAYKFFPNVDAIFKDFDFSINMGAIELHPEGIESSILTLGEDFLKHNAQRYLGFNEGTRYPLVSVLRVAKYKERGYDISKAQMLKLLLAVNQKSIDSWEVLLDEIGSMYGLKADEVFDTTKEFNLANAMEQLDKVFTIPNKMYKNVEITWEAIYKEFEGKWDKNTVDWVNFRNLPRDTYNCDRWIKFDDWKEKHCVSEEQQNVNSFFGVDTQKVEMVELPAIVPVAVPWPAPPQIIPINL